MQTAPELRRVSRNRSCPQPELYPKETMVPASYGCNYLPRNHVERCTVEPDKIEEAGCVPVNPRKRRCQKDSRADELGLQFLRSAL